MSKTDGLPDKKELVDEIRRKANQIDGLENQITDLREQLYRLENAKIFQLWQRYCNLRDSYKTHIIQAKHTVKNIIPLWFRKQFESTRKLFLARKYNAEILWQTHITHQIEYKKSGNVAYCPLCGNRSFVQKKILWDELIKQWGLSKQEVKYLDRQQGYSCTHCEATLRSMTLAAALLRQFDTKYHILKEACLHAKWARKKSILEINEAGYLTQFLKTCKHHTLVKFPQVDIQKMCIESETYDIVIHSDTLEHIPNTKKALEECYRVLKYNGTLFYTIPLVFDRLSKKRRGLPQSYHGNATTVTKDYLVQTEYGANFWVELVDAGFSAITLFTITDSSSLAIIAKKY